MIWNDLVGNFLLEAGQDTRDIHKHIGILIVMVLTVWEWR